MLSFGPPRVCQKLRSERTIRIGIIAMALVLAAALGPALHAAAVKISPGEVTLNPGEVQQFSAAWAGKFGATWNATGGTITETGRYTAGNSAGRFTVTVSARLGSATATVVIENPAAANAPAPSTGSASPPPGSTSPPTSLLVPIYPGDSIQTAVNNYPAGTGFLVKRGLHVRQSIRPKDGMSFIGEPGAVLDGQNSAPQAFIAGTARDVTIRGLRITGYVPPNTNGAIHGDGSQGWLVESNEVDHNSNGSARTYGIRIGSGWIVRSNTVHHNGWNGISGFQAVDTLIEGNDVFANPPAAFNDTIGEAANIKLYGCGRIIIRGNYIHDGPTKGIWLDRSQPNMTVENNRVVNQGEAGIWYEVSYQGVIRGNYVENAGYASYYSSGWLRAGGISVTNSPDVSVLDNTIVNSLNGIIALQASGYYDGPFGASQIRNLVVRGNRVAMPRGQSGVETNIGTNDVFVSWNIRFDTNRYELKTNATPFRWMGRDLDEHQWQAFGQGAHDSFAR